MKINNIAELKTRKGTSNINVEVLGYYTSGDGGGGSFYWDNISTETDNGGTIIQVTGLTTGRWKRIYDNEINVKWFGAKGNGITDDSASLIKVSSIISDNTIVLLPNGNYLVSYIGTSFSSVNGNSIFTVSDVENVKIIGDSATITINNHNISTHGGLSVFTFNGGCRNILVEGIYFDLSFTGVNVSSSYYPHCGAVIFKDTPTGTHTLSELNSDITISKCVFKLYHPFGSFATSGSPYLGDPNNGYKVFTVFAYGDYLAENEINQNKGVLITDCVIKKGHNGYGFWVFSYNDVRVANNVFEDFVSKYSNNLGAFVSSGVPAIRYHQFYCTGLFVENNLFYGKPSSERVGAYQGSGDFLHLNTNIYANLSNGVCVIRNNKIIGGNGDASNAISDNIILSTCYGEIIINNNFFDGINSSSNALASYFVMYSSESTLGDGSGTLTIDGNSFGYYSNYYNNIGFFNGSSVSLDKRRCKLLNITNNLSNSQNQYFINLDYSSASTYSGCLHTNISNNYIEGAYNTVYNSASSNSRAIAIKTFLNDTTLIINNTIKNKYYSILSTIANSPFVQNNLFLNTTINSIPNENRFKETFNLPSNGIFSEYKVGSTLVGTTGYSSDDSMYISSEVNNSYITLKSNHSSSMKHLRWIPFNGGLMNLHDNAYDLGRSNLRWKDIYAGNPVISTSDERDKVFLIKNDKEKLVAQELRKLIKAFKFKESIKEKGEDSARIHFGVSAQEVGRIFEKHDLDPKSYSLFCYNKWDESQEVLTENGEVESIKLLAGDRYGIRYDELLCFILSYI